MLELEKVDKGDFSDKVISGEENRNISPLFYPLEKMNAAAGEWFL